jgi:NAD(P)-dependent dehydrogenase (short-subunit alcohol dehydrogenase family)
MNIDLGGKVAIVTGASSGIGAETARAMGACGARIVAVGRDTARLAEVVGEIEADGGEAVGVQADLAEPSAAAEIVERALELDGGVDILAAAAGQLTTGPLAETGGDVLERLWAVHVRAPYLLTQELLPHLRDGASLLYYSSTVTHVGFAPYAAYSAVKGAIEAFARSLAIELAPKVRVNVIVPGFTATPMVFEQYEDAPGLEQGIIDRTPVGFFGGPESAAGLAAFLCSSHGRYVDGARLVVDGGWTAQGWQA